ncbi:MAG: class I tRNA ligase family protein [Ignavibacteriaceae bacterium]
MAGPFLRADLLKRLIKFVFSEEVYHISHIDTYQSYVSKKASELGCDVLRFREEMSAGIREDFDSFGINFDIFIDNTSDEYVNFLESAVLYLTGRVNAEKRRTRFCSDCHSKLFESYVKGYCKRCFHDCYQNVCENCCQPQSSATLLNPTCGACGSRRFTVSDSHLESWLHFTEADIESVTELMRPVCFSNRRLVSLFRGLVPHEIALTYSTDYGIFPMALDGALNAWVEIYFAHFYAILKLFNVDLSGGFEDALGRLRASSLQPRLIYLFGIDNSYYYAFLFTWLSQRLNLPEMLPQGILANFFLQLNNAKISSSRNNVIWAKDLQNTGTLEELRSNLAFSCPEFAPRNYQSTNLRITNMDRAARDGILASASSEPFHILQETVKALANPAAFSVESLLDTIEKWNRYASKMKESGIESTAASEVEAYLSQLAGHLALADCDEKGSFD